MRHLRHASQDEFNGGRKNATEMHNEQTEIPDCPERCARPEETRRQRRRSFRWRDIRAKVRGTKMLNKPRLRTAEDKHQKRAYNARKKDITKKRAQQWTRNAQR